MSSPLVSIVVSVYNHRPYIEECLRGILAQRVNFEYEVLVGDDCSPDGTADLLRELRPQFPDNFSFILREKNLGAVKNGEDLYARARGTYLVDLEGDDFFTYEGKLQAQVDYLQAHPECSATYTHCVVVGEDSRPNGERYPDCPTQSYTFKDHFYCRLPGQSGTLVCRREQYLAARTAFMEMREFDYYPGDRRNAFLFLCAGTVHVFCEPWSAYRHVKKEGSTSYSSTVRFDDAYARNEVGYGRTLVAYAQRYGSEEALLYARRTYYRLMLKWGADRRSSLRLGDALRQLLHEPSDRPALLFSQLRWRLVLGLRVLRGMPVDL